MSIHPRLLGCLLAVAASAALLGACAGPASQADGDRPAGAATQPSTARSPDAAAPLAPAPGPAPVQAPSRKPPPRMSDPLPPEVLPAPVTVDRSCRTSADCAVKDVGNCCGAYPSCVNRNSRTDPAGVQAECAKRGMASVCGFPDVTGCECVEGRCRDLTGGAVAQ